MPCCAWRSATWLRCTALTYPFTHHINRLLVLLRDAGSSVDSLWWADEFTIYAHQARYEEGHLEADAPLERETILRSVNKLHIQVEHAILALRGGDAGGDMP